MLSGPVKTIFGGTGIASSRPQNELLMTKSLEHMVRKFLDMLGLAKKNLMALLAIPSFTVCRTHMNPQQVDVFLFVKTTYPMRPNMLNGPGQFTTTGIFRASAASNPEHVSISTTTRCG